MKLCVESDAQVEHLVYLPGVVLKKKVYKEYKDLSPKCSAKNRVLNLGFWLSPGVLDGLGSSGGLVGIISTYPGT